MLVEGSVWCDGCSKLIAEGVCAYCRTTYSDNPYSRIDLMFTDENYYTLHGYCIAELVTNGEAEKVGLEQYRVNTGFIHNRLFVRA